MTFVFTIFFCGTGSNILDFQSDKFPDGELISTLGVNLVGQKLITGIVIDGPGSGNRLLDEYWVDTISYLKTRGKITGAGWQENVSHALAVIKCKVEREADNSELIKFESTVKVERNRIYGKSLPDVVNLIGWSRGGVSCHMLAKAMYDDPTLRNIPVNIFAIDPVPGLGNFTSERTLIQNNVYNYVAVYARDERSRGFAPTIPEFVGTRRIGIENKPIVVPMPGRHGTVVGNAAVDGAKGAKELFEPGIIVRHLAEDYLSRWGTRLNEKLNLSPMDIVTAYDRMIYYAETYSGMHSKFYTALLRTENIDGERIVYKGTDSSARRFSDIRGDEYFYSEGLAPVQTGGRYYVNWHHQQIAAITQDEDSVSDEKSYAQSVPDKSSIHYFELNYALSNELVLLNSTKVIFDQPTSVYPVSLEPKTTFAYQSSLQPIFSTSLTYYNFRSFLPDMISSKELSTFFGTPSAFATISPFGFEHSKTYIKLLESLRKFEKLDNDINSDSAERVKAIAELNNATLEWEIDPSKIDPSKKELSDLIQQLHSRALMCRERALEDYRSLSDAEKTSLNYTLAISHQFDAWYVDLFLRGQLKTKAQISLNNENYQFYEAVRNYRHPVLSANRSKEEKLDLANSIFETFVKTSATQQINISSADREKFEWEISRNLEMSKKMGKTYDPGLPLFDDLLKIVTDAIQSNVISKWWIQVYEKSELLYQKPDPDEKGDKISPWYTIDDATKIKVLERVRIANLIANRAKNDVKSIERYPQEEVDFDAERLRAPLS